MTIMKKALAILLCLAMLACALVSCQTEDEKTNAPNEEEVQDEQSNVTQLPTSATEAVYAKAVSLGYEGSLEEFKALVKGDPGKDGVGIKEVTVVEGTLLIALTDGSIINLGKIVQNGADGKDGTDGKTPYIKDGYWWIGDTNTNIKAEGTQGEQGIQGEKGDKGDKGDQGETGATIESITFNEQGQLVIKMTDGREFVLDMPEEEDPDLEEVYVDLDILKKLPQADYEGKQFSISLPNSEHSYQFDPDKITADLERDAIYRWKKKVQDTFNVKIVHQNWNTDSYYADASPAIKNGMSTHNIYGHYAYRVGEFIINGCFQDWNALGSLTDENGTKYLDLSNSKRWDKMLNDEVTYNGKLLSLTGDLGVSKLQSSMAMFVNLDLLDEYCDVSREELYGYVEKGSWTFGKFKTLVSQIYEDEGEPGKDASDVFGFYARTGNSMDAWFESFNCSFLKEENDTITATFMTDSTNATIINKLRDFFHDSDNAMCAYGSNYAYAVDAEAKFLNGEAGFIISSFKNVYGAEGITGMSNLGIVPTPKYNLSQEVYRTKLNDRYTIWGLPTSLKSTERVFTAHITDALCAESSETLYYQYYEVILKGRYSQDLATAKMVNKIMEHPSFDATMQFGYILNMSDYTYLPRNLIADPTKDIESTYDAAASKLGNFLQQIYDCYK